MYSEKPIAKNNLIVEKLTESFAIIGDVHGEISKLEEVFNWLAIHYPNIPLYGTGDLCDRGPNSKEVIELCRINKVKHVLGNHDNFMIQALIGNINDFHGHCYEGMGGSATVRSYGVTRDSSDKCWETYKKAVPQEHLEYLLSFPIARYLKVGKKKEYFISHAGINTGLWSRRNFYDKLSFVENLDRLVSNSHDTLIWEHNSSQADISPAYQILGHYPRSRTGPEVHDHCTFLDSACGKGGILTCMIFPSKEIFTSK